MSPAPASEPAPGPRDPPRLITSLLIDPVAASRMGRVTVEISSPVGETTFKCVTDLKEGAPAPLDRWPCAEAADWLRGPGMYTLRIQMRPNWKSNIPDIRREFRVDGSELGFAALVWLGSMPNPPQNPFVAKFVLDRIRAAPPSVKLQRIWQPAAGGMPEYVIHNGSQHTLHGITMWGNFFGHVEVLKDGRWRAHERGGLCATVAADAPLLPGGQSSSHEGPFIGRAEPFTPGRHRYVVRVALAESQVGVLSERADKGITTYEDRELFELRDEVVIP